MFSSIKDIKLPKYEEAQSADTRLGLNHDKQSSDRRHAEKNKDDNGNSGEYIKENFSVQSLVIYLENHIENLLLQENSKTQISQVGFENKETNFKKWYVPEAHNANTADRKRAVNAYAHTLQGMRKAQNKNMPSSQAPNYSVSDLYALLWDLRHLSEKGIKRLEIDTQEEFIRAIRKAVKQTGVIV
tara:strand:+ start:759 stop:1316 length:558 start_codon:yes stop_codon:yes gene_type:complete